MIWLSKRLKGRALRGSALATALIMIALTSFVTLMMSTTVRDHQRLNSRRRALVRAYYAAEAGVEQVRHWGDHGDDFSPNLNLFTKVIPAVEPVENPSDPSALVFVNVDAKTMFPNLYAKLNQGPIKITSTQLANMDINKLVSDHQYDVGEIEQIELLAPEVSDPVPCFFKVRSTGRAFVQGGSGIARRRVMTYLRVSPVLSFRIPAALISYNLAATGGNARVHWGEAWSKGTFNLSINPDKMPWVESNDTFAKYKTEGIINFNNNWKVGNDPSQRHLYNINNDFPGDFPEINGTGDFEQTFKQHCPEGELQFPTFDYQTFKDMAKSHGRYYGTDAAGNIYRDGIKDASHKVDFQTEFGVDVRETAPYDLVFIDTFDGKPPNEAAADNVDNMATISVIGQSEFGLKGIFFIYADLKITGQGKAESLSNALNPLTNKVQTLQSIFMDGVLYTGGFLEFAGNPGIYGAMIAKKGLRGSGTPDVYFNTNLRKGLPLENGNVGSTFQVVMQTNY